MKSYDLVIIGSGPGGYVAALYASRQKLKVCVIEKDLLGGTCLNRGCIPTKTLQYSASLFSKIKTSKEYGIDVEKSSVNFSKVAARKDAVVTRLRTGIETLFRVNTIDLVKGSARLAGRDIIKVDNEDIRAKSIIVAVGSRPAKIPGIILDEDKICSSDGILNIKKLPRSIMIVGGGVIGCEFASLFNLLGSEVFIVEALDRILTSQSKEVSRKMEVILKKRGVSISTSARFDPSAGNAVNAEKILICTGRTANIEDMGFEQVGIKTAKCGIEVDENLRTSVNNIYAIGDCVAGPQLAHKASYDGMLAVDNIMGKIRSKDYSCIPNCIWTDPEIASVGLTEEAAKAKYPDCRIAKFPYLASGKACLMGKSEGFIKLIGDSKGNILGVEIFGEEACDLIGEAALAISSGINIKDWAGVVHGHPTLSEIFHEAAQAYLGTPIHGI